MAVKVDYSNYSYSRVLEFLQDEYLHDANETNYAKYLLSMKNQSTIEALIKIYDDVMEEIPNLIYLKEFVPEYWYLFELWAGHRKYLAMDVHKCLNENILRLYLVNDKQTDEFAYKCLANLRCCPNIEEIHREIVSKQNSLEPSVIERISNTRKGIYDLRYESFDYGNGTNGMNMIEERYIDCVNFLAKYGYIKSIIEDEFEVKKGVYSPLLENKRSPNIITSYIIISVLLVILVVGILWIGDNLLGIIIFVGACLAVPSIMIKGKL